MSGRKPLLVVVVERSLDISGQPLRRFGLVERKRVEEPRFETATRKAQIERQQHRAEALTHSKDAVMESGALAEHGDFHRLHRVTVHGERRDVAKEDRHAVAFQRARHAYAQSVAVRVAIGVEDFDAGNQRVVVAVLIARHAGHHGHRLQAEQCRHALDDINVRVLRYEMERRDEYRPCGRFLFQLLHNGHENLGDFVEIRPRFGLANIPAKVNPLVDQFLHLRARACSTRATLWQMQHVPADFSPNLAIRTRICVECAAHDPQHMRDLFHGRHWDSADDTTLHAMLSQRKPFLQRGTQRRHDELFLKSQRGAGPRPRPPWLSLASNGAGEKQPIMRTEARYLPWM
ncbi:hypothetical protein BURKHO8Y_110180 [Burkholderia sp. 8Y]|nr:hypothetical protein BURKHO8Y_110180 [Burkholderia sp. 8Y]